MARTVIELFPGLVLHRNRDGVMEPIAGGEFAEPLGFVLASDSILAL